MRCFFFFLILFFSNSVWSALLGSFKSGVYVSPTKQLSCNFKMGISNFNIDLLNDQSVPGSEIVTAMAEHESVYINYLVVLAQENSTSSFMVDTSSDVNELDQVIQNFTNEYLREEQMLEVVVAYEHTFSVDKKQGKLVSYQVSFDNKQQLFSAVFQKLNEFYLIISIMPTLVEDINEVISQETASYMTKELVKSCDVILR